MAKGPGMVNVASMSLTRVVSGVMGTVGAVGMVMGGVAILTGAMTAAELFAAPAFLGAAALLAVGSIGWHVSTDAQNYHHVQRGDHQKVAQKGVLQAMIPSFGQSR